MVIACQIAHFTPVKLFEESRKCMVVVIEGATVDEQGGKKIATA